MGPERWHEASVWPPPEARFEKLYLGAGGALLRKAADAETHVPYIVDEDLGSGARSRWRSLIQLRAPVGYSDRAELAERMLTFTTMPLPASLEITGHPELHVALRTAAKDATLFVYLEDVSPNGRVEYITEGIFRAIHRKPGSLAHSDPRLGVSHTYLRADARFLEPGAFADIAFALQPTSYVVRKGHALRVSIAARDVDNFARTPGAANSFEVRVGEATGSRAEASCVMLPVISRGNGDGQ